jgi:hypothetical protein
MKPRSLLVAVFLSTLIGATGFAQRLENQVTPKSIAGVWKGKLQETDAVPAVEIDLKPDGSSGAGVAGKVIFYVMEDTGGGNEAKGKKETQLLEPKLDGQWLYFRVMREDGTPARFGMKFTKDDEALLSSADEPSPTGLEPVRMIRSQRGLQ